MTNLFLGLSKVSFAALIGDNVIRIKNGNLKQIEQVPIYIPDISRTRLTDGFFNVRLPHECVGNELILKITTPVCGFEWCHYNEPISALPIGDKRVDDCTIEELLFAVKHKLTK